MRELLSTTLLFFTAGLLPVLAEEVEIKRFPLDSLAHLEGRKGVRLDRAATVDGNGAIAIRATRPGRYQLLDSELSSIEETRLIFRAKMKTLKVKGAVFIEVVCHLRQMGTMSSQGLQYSLSGTHHWLDVEAIYPLRKGEQPERVELYLVFDGKGKAWIDDVRLYRDDHPYPEPE